MVPVFIRSTGILINIWLYNVVFSSCSSLSLPMPNLVSDSVEPSLPCNFVPLFPGPATRSSKLPLNESSILPFLPLCDYPAQSPSYPPPILDPSFSLGVKASLSPQKTKTNKTPFPPQYVQPPPLEQLLLPFPLVPPLFPTGVTAFQSRQSPESLVTMASLVTASKPPSHIMQHTLHDRRCSRARALPHYK